jgi:hypothetical protein
MLRNLVIVPLLALTVSASLVSQNPAQDTPQNSVAQNPAAQTPPQSLSETPKQTARQALIEMFMGKDPKAFEKHLPEDTRRALIHKGDTPEGSWAMRIAQLGREITMQGEHVQTFDEGPTILIVEESGAKTKLEVSVEHDSLMGESDEIELSVKHSKDGQETALPIVPRFIFTLQQEKEIWRLTEITAAAHIPLTDPDYLKNLRKLQDESNEGMVQMRVNMIARAEKQYAAQHPERGYSCNLSTVFGEQAVPAQAQAQAEQSTEDSEGEPQNLTAVTGYGFGLGGSEPELWNGYRFTLTGCDGSPVSHYVVTAAPADPDPDPDTKTFCADDSGTIKFTKGGRASSCMSNGEPLNPGSSPMITE